MGVFIYMLFIAGSPWLSSAAVIDFSDSQVDHLESYVEQPAENLEAVGRLDDDDDDDAKELMKDGEGLHSNFNDGKIFKDLCKTFQAKKQFAVLVVGRLSDRYRLRPTPRPPIYNKKGISKGNNYAAAVFRSGGKHTEDTILGYADDMINKYKRKYKHKHEKNPELFLYSKYNPCCGGPLSPNCSNGCAGKIKAKLMELKGKITSMTIAWDYNYKMGAMPFDKAFLFSLNSMMSPGNARLSWNTEGYCRASKAPRKWFQETMFKCLLQTAKAQDSCKKAKVEKDLARLINKVTWICGTRSTAEDEPYPYPLVYDDDDRETLDSVKVGIARRPARDPECWKKEVRSLCSQLQKKAYDCAKQYNSDDLGPALEPSNPTTYSSSATDVRGEYGKLCFESGSHTALKDSQVEAYKTRKDEIGWGRHWI